MFHSEIVGMPVIFLHTKFHMHICSGSLVTIVRLKAHISRGRRPSPSH